MTLMSRLTISRISAGERGALLSHTELSSRRMARVGLELAHLVRLVENLALEHCGLLPCRSRVDIGIIELSFRKESKMNQHNDPS